MAEEEARIPEECDSTNCGEDISSEPSTGNPRNSVGETDESDDAPSTTGTPQYAEAVCECVCTCETCEEMNAFGETEDSMPICICSTHQYYGDGEVLVEEEQFCTCGEGEEVPINGRALYALNCCSCGVQLSAMEACNGDDANAVPEAPHLPNGDASRPQDPAPQANQSPAPPPPPPQLPSLLRVGSVPSNPQTPLTMLRVMSCEDGSPADTRLHEAARIGDADTLRELLKDERRRENVNARVRPFYATPLREAVVGGSRDCVEALLSSGAEVDAVDVKGQTPLLVAASLGQPVIMEVLLAAGADPEGSRYNNSTPLLLCIREGPVAAVETLLRHNVDPEPVSMLTSCVPGWPLQHSVVYRRFECFLALLKGGAETSIERVLAKRPRTADHNSEEAKEFVQDIVRRISITRTILKYASERPEFVAAYQAFGSTFEATEDLPEELRSAQTPARRALAEALESPMRLTSLCRVSLRQQVGASDLPTLAVQAGLPASLRAFLAYKDFDVYCKRDAQE